MHCGTERNSVRLIALVSREILPLVFPSPHCEYVNNALSTILTNAFSFDHLLLNLNISLECAVRCGGRIQMSVHAHRSPLDAIVYLKIDDRAHINFTAAFIIAKPFALILVDIIRGEITALML